MNRTNPFLRNLREKAQVYDFLSSFLKEEKRWSGGLESFRNLLKGEFNVVEALFLDCNMRIHRDHVDRLGKQSMVDKMSRALMPSVEDKKFFPNPDDRWPTISMKEEATKSDWVWTLIDLREKQPLIAYLLVAVQKRPDTELFLGGYTRHGISIVARVFLAHYWARRKDRWHALRCSTSFDQLRVLAELYKREGMEDSLAQLALLQAKAYSTRKGEDVTAVEIEPTDLSEPPELAILAAEIDLENAQLLEKCGEKAPDSGMGVARSSYKKLIADCGNLLRELETKAGGKQ